ncbi:MAG: T9SS type A sorting domain-containing protein [bacterium]|nr:T9SS type A sorting domain-containing protein [bacterium]
MTFRNIFLFFTLLSCLAESQTGPAGIGTSATNVLWLKADAGTSSSVNATAISSWNDQSGNGLNVTQATGNQQPLYSSNIINGFPAIQFDNVSTTNDKMLGPDSPLLDNTAGYTFFMVTRPQNVDGNARAVVSKRTGVAIDQSFMQFYFTGNKFFTDIQTNNDRYNTVGAFSSNNNYLITQLYDGSLAAGSRSKTYIADALDITSAETSASVPDNASPLVIASTDAADSRPFGGYIAEILIYRTALNDASRIIVDNSLSAKYNIAMAANDKYAGDNAGNGDYDRQVSGVGQESSGSSTSFSASVSGGLTMVATAGLDNGDYILAGHALAVNLPILTDVGGMSGTNNARWQRIWYVDVTNVSTNISTNIEFDMSDGGMGAFTLGTNTDYVLLYRAGQAGNWTELTAASSIVGDRILFNGITLTNDGYYTLGTKNFNQSPLPIELLKFTATLAENEVRLNWATATETNSDYFLIEKTMDGIHFEEVCTKKSSGNSAVLRTYSATDKNPYSGLSYYRLTEISMSKVSHPYNLVTVNYSGSPNFIVYPNPADGKLTVQTSCKASTILQLSITDVSGKECVSRQILISLDHESFDVDTYQLKSGTYWVSLRYGDTLLTKTISIK